MASAAEPGEAEAAGAHHHCYGDADHFWFGMRWRADEAVQARITITLNASPMLALLLWVPCRCSPHPKRNTAAPPRLPLKRRRFVIGHYDRHHFLDSSGGPEPRLSDHLECFFHHREHAA
jgi:hypothetical protein